MGRENQIPAWLRHKVADDGCFYVNGFHALIAMQIAAHRKPRQVFRKYKTVEGLSPAAPSARSSGLAAGPFGSSSNPFRLVYGLIPRQGWANGFLS